MGRARATATALFVAIALFFVASEAHAGYTHYWKWYSPPDRIALDAALLEMDKVVDAKRDLLEDGEERTGAKATFRRTLPWGDAGDLPTIIFNGIGDASHETFGFPLAPFPNNPAFSWVKTAAKPYDVVVVACLIVARDHFTEAQLEISSDGTWHTDWADGAELYTKVLGRKAKNPLAWKDEVTGEEPDAPVSPVRWLLFGAGIIAFMAIVYFLRPKN